MIDVGKIRSQTASGYEFRGARDLRGTGENAAQIPIVD
jgi:hypothetical protein